MSRTKHHGETPHMGQDYGARYKCNKSYAAGYGVDARNKADSERRMEDKRIVRIEIEATTTEGGE